MLLLSGTTPEVQFELLKNALSLELKRQCKQTNESDLKSTLLYWLVPPDNRAMADVCVCVCVCVCAHA